MADPGLLYARCAHRGTSLYYGTGEERGIRCCYHGWLYDVEGRCLEQPCEEGGGARRDRIRQPWYPVAERYGLVFAYMGPPEKKPLLPRYECLEELEPGEQVEADDSSIGSGGPQIVPCNWLQHCENVVDPFHVPILHGSFSGAQFVAQMGLMPKVSFETTARGVKIVSLRTLEGGKVHRRVTEAVVPTLRVVPSPRVERYGKVESIGWVLPIDDTTFRIYTAGRVREPGDLSEGRVRARAASYGRSSPRRSTNASPATTRRRPARARSRCIPRSILRRATAASSSFAGFSSSSSRSSQTAAIPPGSTRLTCVSRPATTWRTRARSPAR